MSRMGQYVFELQEAEDEEKAFGKQHIQRLQREILGQLNEAGKQIQKGQPSPVNDGILKREKNGLYCE